MLNHLIFPGIDLSNVGLIHEIADTPLIEYQRETCQRESSDKLENIWMDHLLSNTSIRLGSLSVKKEGTRSLIFPNLSHMRFSPIGSFAAIVIRGLFLLHGEKKNTILQF